MALIVSEQMQQRKKLKFQRELKRHLSSFTSVELKNHIQKMFEPSIVKINLPLPVSDMRFSSWYNSITNP